MKPLELLALVALGAIWGASFLFIRVAAHAFGPFALMFSRVVLASSVLYIYARMIGKAPDLRPMLGKFIVLGFINAAIPFTLIGWSELTLNASLAAIINSLTPLFTAIIASVWGDEMLTPQKIGGVLMGIVGVVILVGGSTLDINATVILAALASVGAALAYGIGAVYASNHFRGLVPIHMAIGQLFGASIVLALPAAATIPAQIPTMTEIGAYLALSLLATAFAYLLFFFLLTNVGPTRALSVTFLVPVFGTLWGVLFLDETFNLGMLVGMVIILLSVGLVISGRYRQVQLVTE